MTTFIHGWGCSRKIWPPLLGHYFDRGYFKEPLPLIPSKKIIVHSFGLHLIPNHIFKDVQELIILSGFLTFVTKKRAVERMLKQFRLNPLGVLSEFIGHPVENSIDKNLLEEDLKRLSVNIFDTEVIKHVPAIKIVHGRLDSITPFEWGQELHKKLPHSRFYPFEGGHFDSIQEAHRLGFF